MKIQKRSNRLTKDLIKPSHAGEATLFKSDLPRGGYFVKGRMVSWHLPSAPATAHLGFKTLFACSALPGRLVFERRLARMHTGGMYYQDMTPQTTSAKSHGVDEFGSLDGEWRSG